MSSASRQLLDQPSLPTPQTDPASGTGLTGFRSLLFAFGFAPLLVLFFLNLWDRPHYQFFPLAVFGALYLAWVRRKDPPQPLQPGHPVVTGLLVAVSFGLLAFGTLLWSPWLGGIATFIGLVGLVWWVGGYNLLKAMLPALLLLLVIIPPPLAADTRLVQQLRVLAVTWSSRLLDLLNITHSLSGNVIELPGQNLLVDEACSGINSVLITFACCLFFGLWRRRSVLHILLCLISSLAFVVLGNMARITVGAWLKARFNIDILSARTHELSGVLLFMLYLVLVLSIDQLLIFLTSPTRPVPARPEVAPAPVALSRPSARFAASWGLAAGCAFAFLGCAQLGFGWLQHQAAKAGPALPKPALREGATFAMPEQIGDWKRLNTEVPPLQKVETMGVYSQIWHYRRGDVLASVALDYPFTGYHDVTVCYTLRGWDLQKQVDRLPQGTNASPPFAEVEMHNHVGLNGALWFSAVDEQGQWISQTEPSLGLKKSILARFKRSETKLPVTYQVQVLVTGFNPLLPSDQQRAERFFQEARGLLWQQIFAQMGPTP
jgi:exosortase